MTRSSMLSCLCMGYDTSWSKLLQCRMSRNCVLRLSDLLTWMLTSHDEFVRSGCGEGQERLVTDREKL